MGIFDFFFQRRSNTAIRNMDKKAADLHWLAHSLAITMLPPLLDRSPHLREWVGEQGTDSWDFFATVAMAYFALILIRDRPADDEFERLSRLVFEPPASAQTHVPTNFAEQAVATFHVTWRKQGAIACGDCMAFVEEYAIKHATTPDEESSLLVVGVGSWVLWNVYGTKPTSEDDDLLAMLGPALLLSVVGYWD